MKIVVYSDNTLPLPVEPLCTLLNSACQRIEFYPGEEPLRIPSPSISYPSTYEQLHKAFLAEVGNYELALLCTNIPYDTNFFYEGWDNTTIISFNGWNILTDLPITNGVVYFTAAILCHEFDIGDTHQENTGCLNDFWWLKTGVDVGMRAGFLCRECKQMFKGEPSVLRDVENLLDLVSTPSRSRHDVLDLATVARNQTVQRFDVFLCHNSKDKPEVRGVNSDLKKAGVVTWLDEERLEPGMLWQAELEKHISNVAKVCVFVGENGTGPWQNLEIMGFLSAFIERQCPVIPVILPNSPSVLDLPIFLRQMMWVDLRRDYEENILRLVGVLLNHGK